jgi:hypothetical protein
MPIRRCLVALVLGLGGSLVAGAAPALAGPCLPPLSCPTTTGGGEPTTTEAPATTASTTTSTTVRATTTTARPVTSTTTTEPFVEDPTTTSTATTLGTTTTSSIPLLVDGPPVDPGTGAVEPTTTTTAATAVPASSDAGRTGRQVALAVGGLLALSVVFAALTVWYWRRTKPRVAAAGTR